MKKTNMGIHSIRERNSVKYICESEKIGGLYNDNSKRIQIR